MRLKIKYLPSIYGLATTAALNAAKNEISNVSTLVKKQIIIEKCQTLKKTFYNI